MPLTYPMPREIPFGRIKRHLLPCRHDSSQDKAGAINVLGLWKSGFSAGVKCRKSKRRKPDISNQPKLFQIGFAAGYRKKEK